jgi:hypothetical protein
MLSVPSGGHMGPMNPMNPMDQNMGGPMLPMLPVTSTGHGPGSAGAGMGGALVATPQQPQQHPAGYMPTGQHGFMDPSGLSMQPVSSAAVNEVQAAAAAAAQAAVQQANLLRPIGT